MIRICRMQIFLLFFCLPFSLVAQWTLQNSPVTVTLTKIVFIDSSGWIIGENGVILHTSDGGNNWIQQNSGVNFSMADIMFLDAQTGWALAWKNDVPPFGTYILNTTNGGATWDKQLYPEENMFLYRIHFSDAQMGWVTGWDGLIASTTDGGRRWHKSQLDTTLFQFFPVRNIEFFSPQYGFACGGVYDQAGMMWRTLDYGRNWKVFPIGPEPLNIIEFIDSLTVLAVGGDPDFGTSVTRSTDGGNTWEYLTLSSLGVRGIATSLEFRTKDEAWVFSALSDKHLVSYDKGITWQSFYNPDSVVLFSSAFTDSMTAFAVGRDGRIYRYDHPVVGISGTGDGLPVNFSLGQNYPNPFNPQTTLFFNLEFTANVRLTVHDALGRQVRTLVNRLHPPGEFHVTFDAAGLPTGIYYYRLTAQPATGKPVSQTRKMLLLR